MAQGDSYAMFSVRNLAFHYGNTPVLSDINAEFEAGKFYTLLGPNGSGKTTFLNLLNGRLRGLIGQVFFERKPLARYSAQELARRFAVIQQRGGVNFPFDCFDIVMMGRHPFVGRLEVFSEADVAIVYDAMEQTDTLQFAQIPITEVSGGECQRVLFARALAQQPQVFFLDEAFSGVDIARHLRALRLLRRLVNEEGRTVFAVTHDLNLAYGFSDEVVVLKNGQIQGQAAPQSLLTEAFIHKIFDVHARHIHHLGIIVTPE